MAVAEERVAELSHRGTEDTETGNTEKPNPRRGRTCSLCFPISVSSAPLWLNRILFCVTTKWEIHHETALLSLLPDPDLHSSPDRTVQEPRSACREARGRPGLAHDLGRKSPANAKLRAGFGPPGDCRLRLVE